MFACAFADDKGGTGSSKELALLARNDLRSLRLTAALATVAALLLAGCNSPYYADRGALLGGLGGAGVGWAIGDAVGNEGAGALIGAGVGALSGAAIGSGLDEVEARNRAQIAAQLGRQVPPGAVTINDVVNMSRSGIDEDLIVTHIQANGAAAPVQAGDLIMLQNEGVSKRVIQALQTAKPPVTRAAAVSGPPVVVEEHYYPAPYWGPPPYWYGYRHCYPRSRVGWGVSVSNF
jgi:hypothetical protein